MGKVMIFAGVSVYCFSNESVGWQPASNMPTQVSVVIAKRFFADGLLMVVGAFIVRLPFGGKFSKAGFDRPLIVGHLQLSNFPSAVTGREIEFCIILINSLVDVSPVFYRS